MKVRYLFFIIVIIILVFAGCNQQLVNSNKIKIPPPFSLFSKNPNNATSDYTKRMEKYNTILGESSIPVFIIDINDLSEKLKNSIELETIEILNKLYGLYVVNTEDKTWPNEFIFINIDSSPELILITFFHEYQHYKCRIAKCYCVSKNFLPLDEQILLSIVREKHALENELKESLKLKDPYLVRSSIASISYYILYSKECIYKMAAITIAKGDLWKKAMEFITDLEKTKKLKYLEERDRVYDDSLYELTDI